MGAFIVGAVAGYGVEKTLDALQADEGILDIAKRLSGDGKGKGKRPQ
jgi:hypothetical protein